jgi:hypothetical protein
MTTDDRDDKLIESMLSQSEPLDDDGFTARVMEALPPRRTRRSRIWILSSFSLLACVLGFLLLPADSFLWESIRSAARMELSPVTITVTFSLLGLAVWGAVSAATSEA